MPDFGQGILGAISTMKEFEYFLKSKDTYAIIMDFHIALLSGVVDRAHAVNKKILLHLDLIKGLSSDESGCEYACQVLQVDGIISTKGKVIEAARRNHKLTVLRLFLIDTKSLGKGLTLCNAIKPDYMEVLPGIACSILPYLKKHTECGIICGGLIRTKQQIKECMDLGASAVTISGVYTAHSRQDCEDDSLTLPSALEM